MKYLVIAILAISLVLIPNIAYAWPEPKYYDEIVVWNGQPHSPLDNFGRWANQTKYCFQYGLDAPPQLDPIQANRWRSSWPINKAKLAERYGIPQDIAEKYGAVYKDYDLGNHY